MKDITYFIFITLHIAAGFTALGTGLSAMITRKGAKPHKKSGKLYYWAMILVSLSAFVLSGLRDSSFLFMIGLFSLYMTVTGNRTLKFKKAVRTHSAFDWWFLGAISIGAIIFISNLMLTVPFTHGMMPVILVFGFFLLSMLASDARFFTNPRPKLSKNFWLLRHISRMMGAYIATLTAFIVTNIQSDPAWIAWLAPTIVFTPIISYHKNKYRTKRKQKTTGVASV